MHRAIDLQATGEDGIVFAAQQEMHIEAGARQHQAVEASDGTRADDAYTWIGCRHKHSRSCGRRDTRTNRLKKQNDSSPTMRITAFRLALRRSTGGSTQYAINLVVD